MISVMVTPSLEVGGLLELGPGAVLDLAVVGPFDAAIAGRDVGRGQHHEAAAEPAGMRGLVELFARGLVQSIADAQPEAGSKRSAR